jgi:hypothetical protein
MYLKSSNHNNNEHSALNLLGCCIDARTSMGCFRGPRERFDSDIEEANLANFKGADSFSFSAHIIPINIRSTTNKGHWDFAGFDP